MVTVPAELYGNGLAVESRSSEAAKLFGLGMRGREIVLRDFDTGVWGLFSNKYPPLLCILLEDRELASDRLLTKSLKLLRISSSRALVASFRLTRSVALSLLRRLN